MSIEAMKTIQKCLKDKMYAHAEMYLAEAIEQAEKQEPVAWQGVHDKTDLYYRKPPQADVRPLYTTPQPQRKWVGFTDEEKKFAVWRDGSFGSGVLWADAQLKEKNK